MSIGSIDVQTLTTALLCCTETRTFQAGPTKSGLFLALMLLTSVSKQKVTRIHAEGHFSGVAHKYRVIVNSVNYNASIEPRIAVLDTGG